MAGFLKGGAIRKMSFLLNNVRPRIRCIDKFYSNGQIVRPSWATSLQEDEYLLDHLLYEGKKNSFYPMPNEAIWCEKMSTGTVAVESAEKAVVQVRTRKGFASGFHIRPDCIATHGDIVKGFSSVRVRSFVGEEDGEVTSINPSANIAFIKVLKIVMNAGPSFIVRPSNHVDVCEEICMLGYDKFPQVHRSYGYLLGMNCNNLFNKLPHMLVNARISTSMFGGPAIDKQGNLVGVTVGTNKEDNYDFCVFAMPSTYVLPYMHMNGNVTRGSSD